MIVRKIFSSISTFNSIEFEPGLNLVVGDKAIGNDSTNGHNVGKTSLVKVLELVLFRKKDKKYFDPWLERFEGEDLKATVEIENGRRTLSVTIQKRLSFDGQDLELLELFPDADYLVRYKSEYDDEFRRPDSTRGKDINWKPFVFGVLGFNSQIMHAKMQLDIDYQKTEDVLKAIDNASVRDSDKTEIIRALQQEANELSEALKKLDFFHYDKQILNSKLTELSTAYASLKANISKLESSKRAAETSLEKHRLNRFDIVEIERIYKEASIVFSSGIVKSFQDLVDFNVQLNESRRQMLSEVVAQTSRELEKGYDSLRSVSAMRARYSEVISKRDYKETYESYQARLVSIEKEISTLSVPIMKKSREEFATRKNELDSKLVEARIALRIEKDSMNEKFNQINRYYRYLLHKVVRLEGGIDLRENSNSNIDFVINIRNGQDDLLALTGEAFRKISCGLVDMAIAATFPEKGFFIVHDGIMDGIAEPIKKRYLQISHIFCRLHGVQYILTGINETIPYSIRERCIRAHLSDSPETSTLFGRKY